MYIALTLLLLLGVSQQTVGQFDEDLVRILAEVEDGSGYSAVSNAEPTKRKDLIIDTPSRICSESRWGKNCGYSLIGYTPVVPKSQWKDVIPGGKKTCSVFGERYIRTFDGATVFYESPCEVLMARFGDDERSPSVWLTRSEECDGCINQVQATAEGRKVIFRKNLDSVEVTVDNTVITDLPIETDGVSIYKSEIWYVIEWGDFVVRYRADGPTSVQLTSPDSVRSPISGLCGDMNGDPADDEDEKYRPSKIITECKIPYSLPFDLDEISNVCAKLDSTHRICNMLLTSAFKSCMTIINPKPFHDICLIEICKGDAFLQSDLLCDVMTEYADECSIRGGRVGEWRGIANCVQTCPAGSQWSECVDSTRTCAALGNDNKFRLGLCSEGCECIAGTYLQGDQCVSAEECKCSMAGTLYEPGAIIERYCGNKCTCHQGHWNCTNESCNGVASSIGLFHYETFDGRSFTYRHSCSVVFAKDQEDFQIVISHEEREDTIYKSVVIVVRTGETWQRYALRRDGKVDFGGKLRNTPLNTGVVDILREYDHMHLTILGKDVRVIYDMAYSVVVTVPAAYKGRMSGLAGDYNDKAEDDFKLRSKFIVKDPKPFVEDWKFVKTCDNSVPEYEYVDTCYLKAAGICSKMVEYDMCKDPVGFASLCKVDACKLPGEKLQTELACSTARGYAHSCMERSNEAFYISLQDTECHQECGEELVYSQESSECMRSCASFNNMCSSNVQAGCYCPEGTFQNDNGACVEAEDCPCLHEGTWYEIGAVTTVPNMNCVCSAGVMSCTQMNETEKCPSPDMQYYSCEDPYDIQGAACEKTCRDTEMFCMAGACMTGCACKSGLYRTPDDKCVPKENCGCFAGEKYYDHGESFKDDCNTVTCMGGSFVRTDLVCPRTCSAVGASHYTSFDGLRYNFEGDCEYILATDYCPNNPNGGLFSVHTKNAYCGSHGMTCSKYLIVTVKNQRMTLERGSEPVIDTIPGTRFRRAVTGFTDYDAAEIFTIKQKGIFTVIDTCIGVTVLWDNGTRIYIRLTEGFQGTTCGMCGNYDGIDSNDLMMATGMPNTNVVEFGNSWKFPPDTTSCPDSTASHQINASCTDSVRREWAINKCRVITDTKGVFASCHETVGPQDYFDICVHDACGCDGGGDCECLCTAIAHYAHDCAQNGAVIEWRSNELCPIMCEEYNEDEDACLWHYKPCATCITDTCCECQQPEDKHWCVEGCFPKCPEGFILDEMTQKCIKKSERDSKCTWYSNENMCHTCEKCKVCKTKSGATLRVEPGQTIYFPIATDACEREWCAMDTTGDLCYNGTIDWYDCNEEYEPIPEYDPRYYTQTCWNSTTSLCSNCRDCKQDCILRNDSCDVGKTPASEDWIKVFPVLPTPKIGAKTYCMKYSCENIPEASEPQCYRQRKSRVICQHNIEDVICKDHEVLKIYPTGDDCCPEKYECVCDVCAFDNQGTIEYVKTIEPGETKDWCEDEDTSNCCYTDTCTVDEDRLDKTICPVMTRKQSPCTTGPAPTCSPGYIWKNLTRSEDCCPWGECECDACYDFDERNNKVLKLIGDEWNKKCMKFRCVRGVRDITGCFKTKNFENITCAKKPECRNDQYVKVVGIDEWECCDIYDCVCYDQCHITVGGTERVIDPGQEIQMDDGCWYKCIDPRTSEDDKNCPRPEKTCHAPKDCEECEFINDTVNDTCGCPKYDCQTVERCPSIDCPFPYVRFVDPTADKCKEPCYDCKCEECWDQYQNRTYQVGKTWRRQYVESAKCEDCSCTNDIDEDGCKKETCTPTPCPEVETCEAPYDTAIYGKNECGCTILLGCKCPYCVFNGKIFDGKNPADKWTVGDLERGCYDTYQCLSYKNPGMERECYNITKERKPCIVDDECPDDFVPVKNEEKSCYYDDEEHCPRYDCECVKCRFNGVSYNPGETWNKDCIDYKCLNVTDESDPAKCKKIESKVVDCPDTKLECKDCYVQYLKVERSVPDECCDIWDCKPELFCVNEKGERVDNGTVWKTHECRRVQCIVSKEDWASGICPAIVEIDHCDPDPTTCNECQNKTIVKDKCECDKVTCPPNAPPKSCKDPSENMILDYFNTGDSCYSTKNCCVCDDACYYKGVRKDLFSVWKDEKTCQRLRCVLPEATVTKLGFNYDDIYFDDLEDVVTPRQVSSKLNYRKLLSDTNIPKSLYAECSQDVSLCPVTLEIGCEKPKECGECEHTEESEDACGCPILKCTPYVCPPAPYDVNVCTEPKAVLKNISLSGLTELYPCCDVGRVCECRKGCLDKDGVLREVGETWDETGTNECGRTLTRKRCQSPSEFEDPKPECPKEVKVPCAEPEQCQNCENRTSYIDEYCCEIAKCGPLNEPVQCVEPKLNQRVSTLETQDECFPSKQCCVCDTACSYKGKQYQLFQVWEDAEACSRLRCVLPEETIRALGYAGEIDFKDLTNSEMTAKFSELKSAVDYRTMMINTKVSEKLYEQCQQNISLCPKTIDIGCKPVIECEECHTTTITQDSCGCDVATCDLIERCPYLTCKLPKKSREIADADPCKAPCYECSCDHVCFDNFDNSTHEPESEWKRTYREPVRKCESCVCTNDIDEKDDCLKESCEPIPCPKVAECAAPYNKAIYGTDDCGCQILIDCECTQCMYEGEIVKDKIRGNSWTVGKVELGCYDTYYCDPLKDDGKTLECYNVTKTRSKCIVDPECPKDHVAVKNEEKSCCIEDMCCPRYDCECVKCRFDGVSYNPGDTWTKDCIDYTCTNITNESDPDKCKRYTSKESPCSEEKPTCKDCYVQYLATARNVSKGECCNIWDCQPEKVCIKEDKTRVPNGTIWEPAECSRVQCTVSEEDWTKGVCPTIVTIDHCDPDPTTCLECQNTTIVKDKCGCDKVTCPPNNPPKHCVDPSENMIVESISTEDKCYPQKSCCVCDDACYYNGERKNLFEVWTDKAACKRLRCVLPDPTLTALGYVPADQNYDDMDDDAKWREMKSKLSYRKIMDDTKIATSLYSTCSQDASLCPVTYDMGCEKPKECGECERTEEAVDDCGCPIFKCTPYVCPPAPYDVEKCVEPKAVMKNISLAGLHEDYPCCKTGRVCECRKGCLDKDGILREIGEIWVETGTNDCGRTSIKKKCQAVEELPKTKRSVDPECPKEVLVPCDEPLTCENCMNRTSYIDDFCCEIAKCEPLNEPVQCVEPKENQRISTLETGDECFPSKSCCVCDTTCSYKDGNYQLFQVWEDAEACSRLRCVLPEATIRALGYTGEIDYKDLTNVDMMAQFNTLKGAVDYRRMMLDTKVPEQLYAQCQQNISLCPKTIDIGCKPVIECGECHTTTITQDSCGCDVATCDLIERCPYITCPTPKKSREIADADPCKAPCYECSCDHICLDNFDNSTRDPGTTWKRTYREPERKCESCVCTNDIDEKDDCLKETCEPIPCPKVAECEAPYNKAIYGTDDCGCQILIECECTQCMYEGEVLPDRKRGDSWTEGNVALGCYDTYYCEPNKNANKTLECYEVTKTRSDCIVDDECPEDHVPVKNEAKSCCIEDKCCPRYDCLCVKCRFDGVSYNPGDTWTKDCIDYTCTNITNEADPDKCKRYTSKESPCSDKKPVCKDCYVEYLATKRDVSKGECCNIWDCKPENVCVDEEGGRTPNGTIWKPSKCERVQCFVSQEDFTKGVCPKPVPIDHCTNDLTEPCPPCTNKTIVKDECDCDSVSCPPNREPEQCVEASEKLAITTLATEDSCFPSKTCCMCDGSCYYKGTKKALFAVWIDEDTCERMRCLPSETLLTKLGYDTTSIDFKDVDNTDLWEEIRSKIDYRQMMIDSKIATKLYEACSQDISLCPSAKTIGCPEPIVCPNCTNTVKSKDSCGCTVHTCDPFKCPPSPYDVTECTFPKTNLVEISLKGLTDKYPCCSVGRECTCHPVCFDSENKPREIGEEWDETTEYECSADPSVSGSVVRKRCNPGKASSTKDEEKCPYTTVVPCEQPDKCEPCEETIQSLDERCCPVVTCKKIECEINTAEDCTPPKTALKSDATVTGNECCPKYCDCPEACTETETGSKYDRNLEWPHPTSDCWTRKCLVDSTRVENGGCPYIINQTVCTEPKACEECFTAKDSLDACGCTTRKCERNPCPTKKCDDECDELYETGTDGCGCPVLSCRPKPCPTKLITCDDPEKNVYSWMDLNVDKCCKQQGCRCNYTKCVERTCPPGQIPVRNVSAVKCCCPEYMCVPNDDSQCTDYNGVPRKIGEPWINKDNKCKMLQCSYENTKSRITTRIEEFDRFLCSSEKPSCVNGGMPYLASTKEGCCSEWVCPCTCQVYGDPHFTTFDGFSYDYQGKCTYTLMKEYAFNKTEVIVDNELCKWQSARRKSLSCLKTMTVMHKGVNHTFTFGNKFELNGEQINARKEWKSADGDVTVREFGYKQLRLQINSLGLVIVYKARMWMQSLILTIPYETLEGKMLGLCGSCNNDPSDDFRNKAYKVLTVKDEKDQEAIDKFGEGWIKNIADFDQPKCFPVEPDCPEESVFPDCGELPSDECIDCENKCHLSHPKCSSCEEDPCQVLRTHDVFKAARANVDPRVYMSKCAYDLSQENNVTNKCDACYSPSIAQYAALNEKQGICIPWRTALNCEEIDCPHESQEYRECDLDAKRDLSCDMPVLNVTASVNVEGCFCPEGMIRRSAFSEECIPMKCCSGCSEPPKCEDGSVAKTGERTDDCGCPVYMCSDVVGCEVQIGEQDLEVDVGGKVCKSTEKLASASCAGNCAAETRAVNGDFTTQCSKCAPTSTETRTVTLICEDGSSEQYENDVISGCECASFSCSSCPETKGISGDL